MSVPVVAHLGLVEWFANCEVIADGYVRRPVGPVVWVGACFDLSRLGCEWAARAPDCARPAVAGPPTSAPAAARARPEACATPPAAGGGPPRGEVQQGRLLGGPAAQLLLRAAREGDVGAVQRMMQVARAPPPRALPCERPCVCFNYRRHAVSRREEGGVARAMCAGRRAPSEARACGGKRWQANDVTPDTPLLEEASASGQARALTLLDIAEEHDLADLAVRLPFARPHTACGLPRAWCCCVCPPLPPHAPQRRAARPEMDASGRRNACPGRAWCGV